LKLTFFYFSTTWRLHISEKSSNQ